MKTELASRDIYWIAKGCWEHNFNWKAHPNTKADWLVALITGISGLAILVVGAIASSEAEIPGIDAVFAIGVISLLIGLGFFFKGQYQYNREKQEFIDMAVAEWESTKAIPSLATVKVFVNPQEQAVNMTDRR